jgi:D-alanyl-D-alanine carboxypeptidase/D-alanyl-D-alanine-endopeptidase (penicillin-binding protein 4)
MSTSAADRTFRPITGLKSSMRVVRLAVVGAMLGWLGWAAPALASPRSAASGSPQTPLEKALSRPYGQLGRYSSAYALDLTTGQTLFARNPDTARLPASVEKLYTTSTALVKFGATARLTTALLGMGSLSANGTWRGSLYLRGGGDPSFGSAAFDRSAYGSGATIERLVANLQAAAHIRALQGRIVGDSNYLDGLAGTVASGYAFNPDVEGSLSALPFNRGLFSDGSQVVYPAAYAARELSVALRAAHVRVPKRTSVSAGRTPATARLLAVVRSPSMAQLLALTNTPSDNFFAEMLTKDLGARFGAAGSTAAGVAVIRNEISTQFGLTPRFDDGSGLSRDDATSPRQVVSLLRQMADNPTFTQSLAIAGETGTLGHEMVGTAAAGRCIGKTGTLRDVASLAGYCHAADGHVIAFAVLANALGNPDLGHQLEAKMAVALVRYSG